MRKKSDLLQANELAAGLLSRRRCDGWWIGAHHARPCEYWGRHVKAGAEVTADMKSVLAKAINFIFIMSGPRVLGPN